MSVKHYTKDNFEKEVLKSDGLILVDFWASYCGPCNMLAPVIEEFASNQNDAIVGKVDTQAEPGLAAAHRVMSIPTIILFKDGQEVDRVIGPSPVRAPEIFQEMIAKHK